ncbi:MAG: quinone oxidoreductase [Actinobacteria bacterium]|nr:MAG: quinone oxidoreductase [Actinomycetota bacterium]
MKAIVVSELGGPEQLKLEEVPDPTPGEGEAVVEISAAGLNFIDTYHRTGLYEVPLPFTPGTEGAGKVLEVGSGVELVSPGDRVGWATGLGSYAEKVVVPADKLIPIPDDVSDDTAIALFIQGLTAHYLATDTFPLDDDSTCLIHAGAGGVGLLLTQIARIKGARVITTVGTVEKAEISRSAGASEVILYRDVDFATEVERLIGPNAVDVVYDGVGAATFMQGLDVLRPRGMMVTFGNASGPVPEISPLLLARKGSVFLTRPTLAHYVATRDELIARANDLFGWVREGSLEVEIGLEFDLAEARQAHEALEARKTTGKVLLRP